ncbi:MAG: hypothetical protein IKN38_07580 [Clostridia bacterium]|nr:hypothetical protein [Clostridia bacterium]
MKKIDKTVLKETVFVAAGSAVLSLLLNSVYLIIGKWDITVLLGNLLGVSFAVFNFFLMGLTVQSALGADEKSLKTKMRFSMLFREILLFAVAAAGYLLPSVFDIIAILISYFFPRIVIMFRPKFKMKGDDADNTAQAPDTPDDGE